MTDTPRRTEADAEAGDYIEDQPETWAAFVETLRRYHDHLNAARDRYGDDAYGIVAGAMLSYLYDEHSVYLHQGVVPLPPSEGRATFTVSPRAQTDYRVIETDPRRDSQP